ncbi:MAG: DUF937 domain-containing protein [Hyphomicrobiales bacterium]
MDLIDLLAAAQGGNAYKNVGHQFGLSEQQTAQAFEALAPVLAAGIRRNAANDGGYDSLIGALSDGHHQAYFDDENATQYDNVADDGNRILGHVFGSKEVSREVANYAAGETGIGAAILKKLLPIIVSMILGSLTKGMGGGGRQPQPRGGSGGGLGDILGDILGGGAGGQQRRAPAPQPQNGPGGFGDILRDILGGGGGGRSCGVKYDTSEKPDMTFDDSIFRQDPQRGRDILDDYLGHGSSRGTTADDLLNSVEQAIRGRRY